MIDSVPLAESKGFDHLIRVHSPDVLHGIIDSLHAHIAILDDDANITMVNQSWKDFMDENGGHIENHGVGTNYLNVCEPLHPVSAYARHVSDESCLEARQGILDILAGRSHTFRTVYPCHSPDTERWFMMTVKPLQLLGETGALVAHENVTQVVKKDDAVTNALIKTVEAMSNMAEYRDAYTADHQKNVARLAAAIAEEMQLTERQIQSTYLAASIHDIGKIAVPSEILTLPRKLSGPEQGLIRQHPVSGYDMLKQIPFPWPIADIVLQHHERIDGSGYPAGLQGEEINIEARIIGVADTADSMISHRPYRPGLGLEHTNETIREGNGTLYDPDVVEAYFSEAVQALMTGYPK